jgi:hypothetical protein
MARISPDFRKGPFSQSQKINLSVDKKTNRAVL